MKARDIVPGWPRGKSTTSPSYEPDFLWIPSHRNIYESVCEARLESLYHEGQQAMVDYYRNGGFSPFEPIADFMRKVKP